MTAPNEVGAFPRPIWLSIGLGLFAAVAIALTILGLRSDAFDAAAREQTDLATVLGREISDSNLAIDAILHDVTTVVEAGRPRDSMEFSRLLDTASIQARLRAEIASTPKIDVVTIVGSNGDIVNISRNWPAANENISHEDDFIHLSENATDNTYISLPVGGPLSGDTHIYFSRRMNAPDGGFLGIVQVGMTLNYYYSIYSAISALKDKAILLSRRDGAILFRFPKLPSGTAESLSGDSPWRDAVAAGGGAYRSRGFLDGKPSLVIVRPLADYPLVVDVSETNDAILALWRTRANAKSDSAPFWRSFAPFFCCGRRSRIFIGCCDPRRCCWSEAGIWKRSTPVFPCCCAIFPKASLCLRAIEPSSSPTRDLENYTSSRQKT